MIYRFSSFELDVDEARLRRDGEAIEVQPKVLDALRLFVESNGRLLSREELLERLWPGVIVAEESLTQVVSKLRQVLGDDREQPRYLATVYKRGYRFLAEVTCDAGAGPKGSEFESTAPPMSSASATTPRPRSGGEFAGLVAAVLLATLGAVVLAYFGGSQPSTQASSAESPGWRVRRLTATPERESFPALAPDGKRFAFVRAVPPSLATDLFIGEVDGGWTRLTATSGEEFAPQFSPDGRTLLYSVLESPTSSIWTLPALGGPARRVVEDAEWATWAPGGAEIAFVRRELGGRSALHALRLDDGTERTLWTVDGPLSAAMWSPNGRFVAAIGRNQVVYGGATAARAGAANPAPRAIGPIFEYVRSLSWESDGAAVILDGRIAGGGGNLIRLPLDGGPLTPLTRGSVDLFHPTLSRDGGRLLYVAEHKVRQIWRYGADLRPVEALSLPTGIECFDVAPDGASIAATDWVAATEQATLAIFDLAGGASRPLGAGLCPAFSPTGDRIAFLGFAVEDRGLWVLDLGSGERRLVAPDRGDLGLSEANAARRPAWSPDGERLAYEGVDLPEGSGIFVLDLATQSRRLVAPGVYGNLAWSADGRHIAVSGAGPEIGFALVDTFGSTVLRVGDAAGGACTAAGAYRASAFFRADGRAAFLCDQTARPALVAVSPGNGETHAPELLEVPRDASFRGMFEFVPDRNGGYLAIIERYESDLYLADLERPQA